MNNKGQSALEYLMTYGWALVVIIIVIAALFAFGIFNPPTGGTCRGLDKLLYKDHTAAQSGASTLSLQNGTGSTINDLAITFGGDFNADGIANPAAAATIRESDGTDIPTPYNVGSAGVFVVSSADAGPTTTGNYSGTITIQYTNTSTGLVHSETATCTGNI